MALCVWHPVKPTQSTAKVMRKIEWVNWFMAAKVYIKHTSRAKVSENGLGGETLTLFGHMY
jgi:hypothetical protein